MFDYFCEALSAKSSMTKNYAQNVPLLKRLAIGAVGLHSEKPGSLPRQVIGIPVLNAVRHPLLKIEQVGGIKQLVQLFC